LAVGGSSLNEPGNAAFSGNGAQWVRNALTGAVVSNSYIKFYRAACGNGTWVVAGQRYSGSTDTISCSTDGGQSWTTLSAQTTFDTSLIHTLVFADGKFIIGGAGGKMAWSEDGSNWTAIPPGTEDTTTTTFGDSAVNGIAWGAGKWIAVGAGGKIAQSADGIHWNAMPPGTGPYTASFGTSAIRGVSFCNGRFYAVGADGKMAYSNQIANGSEQ
jgi:hypothetical protein